jgi:hypothetical protein
VANEKSTTDILYIYNDKTGTRAIVFKIKRRSGTHAKQFVISINYSSMGIYNINAVMGFMTASETMIRSQNCPKFQLLRQIYHGLGCMTKIFPVISTKRLEVFTRVAAQSAFGKVHDICLSSLGYFHLAKNIV